MKISKKIYKLRSFNNVSILELSKAIQISIPRLILFEKNLLTLSLEETKIIANYFNVTIDTILNENIYIYTKNNNLVIANNGNTINKEKDYIYKIILIINFPFVSLFYILFIMSLLLVVMYKYINYLLSFSLSILVVIFISYAFINLKIREKEILYLSLSLVTIILCIVSYKFSLFNSRKCNDIIKKIILYMKRLSIEKIIKDMI